MNTPNSHADEFTHLSAKIYDYVVVTGHLISSHTLALTCYDARQDRDGNFSCDVDTFVINHKHPSFLKLLNDMNERMRIVHFLPLLVIHADWQINFPGKIDHDRILFQKFMKQASAAKLADRRANATDPTFKIEFINGCVRFTVRLPQDDWNHPSVRGMIERNIRSPGQTISPGQYIASWGIPHIPPALNAEELEKPAKIHKLAR